MTDKSEFSLYSAGYIDGYNGNPRAYLDNCWYILGYEEGLGDDTTDQPCKYTHDADSSEHRVSTVPSIPIRPDQSGLVP